jgi:hypothetical protein
MADTPVSGYQWGTWDVAGSPYILTGTVTAPKSEPLSDRNGNGVWDPEEPYDDLNGNGRYDYGEPFTDLDGDDEWDPAETYTDLDGNGYWTDLMPPLIIESGVEVTGANYRALNVSGLLEATGVTFSGGVYVQALNGG